MILADFVETPACMARSVGVGVRVTEAMRDTVLPEDVELVDGGMAGADLLYVISDRSKVIVSCQ